MGPFEMLDFITICPANKLLQLAYNYIQNCLNESLAFRY